MNERDFVYWLQGALEFNNPTSLNEKQTSIIKDHLKLVLDNKTPEYDHATLPWTPYEVTSSTENPGPGKGYFPIIDPDIQSGLTCSLTPLYENIRTASYDPVIPSTIPNFPGQMSWDYSPTRYCSSQKPPMGFK
mgnify:CR=1 FL=1